MTPQQIGALSEHCQTICKKYKDEYYFRSGTDHEWEEELVVLIDQDKRLPDYSKIDTLMLDFLLGYFESEIKAVHETWDNTDE